MAKYLEYPIETQEVAGSNPRQVTFFFLNSWLIFLFGIRVKQGSPSS